MAPGKLINFLITWLPCHNCDHCTIQWAANNLAGETMNRAHLGFVHIFRWTKSCV